MILHNLKLTLPALDLMIANLEYWCDNDNDKEALVHLWEARRILTEQLNSGE